MILVKRSDNSQVQIAVTSAMVQCQGCLLMPEYGMASFMRYSTAVSHLAVHVRVGHKVPRWVTPQLRKRSTEQASDLVNLQAARWRPDVRRARR